MGNEESMHNMEAQGNGVVQIIDSIIFLLNKNIFMKQLC